MQALTVVVSTFHCHPFLMTGHYVSTLIFGYQIQYIRTFQILFVHNVSVHQRCISCTHYLAVHFDSQIKRSIVAGHDFRISFRETVIVDDARMILKFHTFPTIYGIRIYCITDPDILYDSSLIIERNIYHRTRQVIHRGEGFVESFLFQKTVVGVIPLQIIVRFPTIHLAAFQDIFADELQAWRSTDCPVFTPVYNFFLMIGETVIVIFTQI